VVIKIPILNFTLGTNPIETNFSLTSLNVLNFLDLEKTSVPVFTPPQGISKNKHVGHFKEKDKFVTKGVFKI